VRKRGGKEGLVKAMVIRQRLVVARPDPLIEPVDKPVHQVFDVFRRRRPVDRADQQLLLRVLPRNNMIFEFKISQHERVLLLDPIGRDDEVVRTALGLPAEDVLQAFHDVADLPLEVLLGLRQRGGAIDEIADLLLTQRVALDRGRRDGTFDHVEP
jgi:hypothetical protein